MRISLREKFAFPSSPNPTTPSKSLQKTAPFRVWNGAVFEACVGFSGCFLTMATDRTVSKICSPHPSLSRHLPRWGRLFVRVRLSDNGRNDRAKPSVFERRFDRACAGFWFFANLLFEEISGFCCLSVYHQNKQISCRGGVPPPENERCMPIRSVYYPTKVFAPIAFPSGEGGPRSGG